MGRSRTSASSSRRASGASSTTASNSRWNDRIFTGTSKVMFNTHTCAIATRLSSAPSRAVRGRNSSTPPSTSAAPSRIS
ncbi:Uncharacterised protein [Mycobacteroides abscessus subsp. abscessus]|nr:Uncharacterised protein [Mycobacteroides abscessus subsp. abscessus]